MIGLHTLAATIYPLTFGTRFKAENPIAQVVMMDSSPDPLNLEQRKLYDTVMNQYSQELAVDALPPASCS